MREAIGATWIMGIVIAFVALFSAYLAFSINYSKAFRVKNGIVERIEKHNGFYRDEDAGAGETSTVRDIYDFMNEINYGSTGDCQRVVTSKAIQENYNTADYIGCLNDRCFANAQGQQHYCIQKITSKTQSDQLTTAYYKVYVFFAIDFPILHDADYFFVTTGETKSLSYPKDSWLNFS
jgi:hypothetical protein